MWRYGSFRSFYSGAEGSEVHLDAAEPVGEREGCWEKWVKSEMHSQWGADGDKVTSGSELFGSACKEFVLHVPYALTIERDSQCFKNEMLFIKKPDDYVRVTTWLSVDHQLGVSQVSVGCQLGVKWSSVACQRGVSRLSGGCQLVVSWSLIILAERDVTAVTFVWCLVLFHHTASSGFGNKLMNEDDEV